MKHGFDLLVIFLAIHALVILELINKLPFAPTITYLLPAMLVDGLIMWGIITFVERRARGSR